MRRQRQRPVAPFTTAELLAAADADFLVDDAGAVLESSATAAALGVVFGRSLVNLEIARLVEVVRSSGRREQAEIDAAGREFVVEATPIGVSAYVLGRIREVDESHRLDVMRRDFVANVSHELKTPIGGLSLLAEAITDAADDREAVIRFAERMRVEVTRLNQLVTDLLSLSQLQSYDPLYDASVVSIDQVVDLAMDRVRLRAAHKGIAIVPGGDRGVEVFGNEDHLVIAMSNLILNAIAYSPEKTQVGIGVHCEEEMVEIKVSDQGIGIPESEQERIFERFYRVDAARSRVSGGTGLGLSIVKHIIGNHGGTISVWSREDEGSTFTVSLPRATTNMEQRG